MKRKVYQKPKTKVEKGVVSQVLAASNGIGGKIQGYGDANDLLWGDDDKSDVKVYYDGINW